MRTPVYDILRKDPHGAPVWMEAAPGIKAAKARILHLAERFPADYIIFHQSTARIVANFHFKTSEFASILESTSRDQRMDHDSLSSA